MKRRNGGMWIWGIALIAALILGGCNTESDDPPSPKTPKTWTMAALEVDAISFNRVAFGNNVFVATGDKSYVFWSEDGVTWTKTADIAAFGGSTKMGVSFQKDKFIATYSSGAPKNWATSSNGREWTATGNPDANFNAKGSVFGAGYYLVSGGGGNLAYTTDTTKSWTTVDKTKTTFTANSSGGYINALAFGNGRFVAGGGTGHTAWISASDLTGTWAGVTQTETIFDKGFINSMVFAEGRFIAVGGLDNGTGKAAYSENGETWTQSDAIHIGDNTMVTSIAYGDGIFVAADNKGNASYSTDKGITWTLIGDTTFSSDTKAINGICYGKGTFVIAGAGGRIAYSIPE